MNVIGLVLGCKSGFVCYLADDFSFLPSQIFASAFSALGCAGGVSCSTFSADFHVEPVFLGKGFLEGIHYRQLDVLR